MDLQLLAGFFENQNAIDQIKADIKNEVEEYSYTSRHKDSSRLPVSNENDYDLSNTELIELLRQYLDDRLTEIELEYILSVLDLSEWTYGEKARDIIFSFCDPYLGYPITKPNIVEAIHFLNTDTDSQFTLGKK